MNNERFGFLRCQCIKLLVSGAHLSSIISYSIKDIELYLITCQIVPNGKFPHGHKSFLQIDIVFWKTILNKNHYQNHLFFLISFVEYF